MTKQQKLWKPDKGRFGAALKNVPDGGGLNDYDFYIPGIEFCIKDSKGKTWAFTYRDVTDYGYRRVT